MGDSVSSHGSTPYMAGCVHPYQCPNRLCQRSFSTQRGLLMHFYHQENSFCNPPERFRTNAEMAYPYVLPQQMPPLPLQSLESSVNINNDDAPCWSVEDGDSGVQDIGMGGPPAIVNVNHISAPDVDALQAKFGMSYTSAHVIETKLAKMLNDIQAPKQMYSSILKWGREAYNEGYNFVPQHGTKGSLIKSLQTQLHLDHF
jgi:hypothetical protein